MKTRALGLFLMVTGACAYGAGCGSSNSGGTGGTGGRVDAGGTGGKVATGGTTGSGGATGTGGATATGGATGTGGRVDAGGDATSDNRAPDATADAPGDLPVSTDSGDGGAPTWTDVFAIITNNVDTTPGCAACHDGFVPGSDGGTVATTLPHLLNFRDKTMAYAQLVGINSIICSPDGGTVVKRIAPSDAANSVLIQKVSAGLGLTNPPLCGGSAMPRQRFANADAGPDGGDAGTIQVTHYAVTLAQLQTITAWVNAGAAP